MVKIMHGTVGFAPFDHPKIAMAVLLENAGFGGAKAAPVAGLVMERYLFGEIRRKVHKPVLPIARDTLTHVAEIRKH